MNNVTVDNELMSIVYEPKNGQWFGQPSCNGCTVQPDLSKAYANTWASATYDGSTDPQNIAFSFTGEYA